jgi:conjugative relaxase-like TrwC/TraI family protein
LSDRYRVPVPVAATSGVMSGRPRATSLVVASRAGDTPELTAIRKSFPASPMHLFHRYSMPPNIALYHSLLFHSRHHSHRLSLESCTPQFQQTCAFFECNLGRVGLLRGMGALVLSSAKIGLSSWRYYQRTVAAGACEYYLGVGEAPGRWTGRGLDALGLEAGALVSEVELEAMFARGLHPVTGARLGRAWRTDAVTGFDLTFSAPKSVSVLWALGGPTAGRHVLAAHQAAVRAGLSYLDTHAGLSRRGTDGVEQIGSAGLVAAMFDHRTSRAGDPQLHTHALVLNKVQCVDGVWRSLDGHEMFAHKKTAGAMYQAALRAELHQRLGVVFEAPSIHGQAEIAGVPTELMAAWSKRAAQIRAEAEPVIAEYETTLGRDLTKSERAAVVKTAVLKTRTAKETLPDAATLHGRWAGEAAGLGWGPDELHAAVTAAVAAGVGRRWPAYGYPPTGAVATAGRKQAVFTRADVTLEICARYPILGGTGEQTRARIEQFADRAVGCETIVPLGNHPTGVTARASDPRYTSTDVLFAEGAVLRIANDNRAIGTGRLAAAALDTIAGLGLAADQAAAVATMTGGGDFLTVLTAPAGAGKTTTLGAAARLWQGAGYQVMGLAPSARAAAELAKATGGRCETLAKWVHAHRAFEAAVGHHHNPLALQPRSVVIVDEASMASTFDLATLVRAAARANTKVVLVGDPAQIGVINGPGGILSALADRGHGIELAQVHRFGHDWEAAASLRLRQGDPTVINTYEQAGRIHAVDNPDHAITAVFTHWQNACAEGHDTLMLARTRADVDALNTLAKTAAQASGTSAGPVLEAGGRSWQAGDVLGTRRNNRTIPLADSHVRNGDRYRVLTVTADGGLLVDDLAGRGRTLLPSAYVAEHVDYGWATTIDAAQGATTDVGIVLVRPGIDREHLYVAMTRGRQANHAYITGAAVDTGEHPEHGNPNPPPAATVERTLTDALAHTSRQRAAHTLLDYAATNPRSRAAQPAGRKPDYGLRHTPQPTRQTGISRGL